MLVTVACHCKSFEQQLDLAGRIPQEDTFCCCTSCRQRTGQLAIFPFPSNVEEAKLASDSTLLQPYKTTNEATGNSVTSYFCSKCGSKLFIQVTQPDGKWLGGGWMIGCFDKMLDDTDERKPIIKLHGHSWLDDTIDGGLAAFWKNAHGQPMKLYDGSFEIWTPPKEIKKDDKPYLNLHCRCGGFSVFVKRPEAAGTGTKRYPNIWCACTSCRVASGSCLPAFPWLQIPLKQIFDSTSLSKPFFPPPEEMSAQTDLPGLTRYHSSPGKDNIARYHCSTCGASIMFLMDKPGSPEEKFADIAAGLIDSPEGALASSWIDWWNGRQNESRLPVDFSDEGKDRWGGLFGDFMEDLRTQEHK